MLGTHAVAGLLEAAVTLAIVGCLAEKYTFSTTSTRLSGSGALVVVVASLALAVLSLPTFGLASSAPDGYEASISALRESGLALGSLDSAQRLAGLSATVQHWQTSLVAAIALPEIWLALTATVIAGMLAWGGATACARKGWQPSN